MDFCLAAEFPATHRIRIDSRGTLEPLHAHNWRVKASLRDARGEEAVVQARVVLDAWVARHEGACFNDVAPFDTVNPTAEEVARSLAELLDRELPDTEVRRVEIGEAAGFSATYWPGEAPGAKVHR